MAFASTRKNPVSTDNIAELFTFANGDVKVKINHRGLDIEGKVFSSAMAMASPIWRKFIYPPWAQPSQMSAVELDFSEDSSDALLILLRITHLQFKHIPSKKLSQDEFHGIAELCDLYDCVELVKPWLAAWISSIPFSYETSLDLSVQFPHKWLFSSWVFGKHDIFEETAQKMTSAIDFEGNFKVGDSMISLAEAKLPPGILERILVGRRLIMEQVLAEARSWVEKFATTKVRCMRIEKDSKCDALLLGGFIRTLAGLNLWPSTSNNRCKLSVDAVIIALEMSSSALDSNHSMCGVFNGFTVESKMPTLTTEAHREHMRIQAERLKEAWDGKR